MLSLQVVFRVAPTCRMETKLGRKVFSVTKRNLIGRSVKMRRSNRRFSPVGLATFGLSHGFKAEEVLPDWLLHQVLRLETTSPFSSPSTGPSTHLRALITKFKSESLEISAQTTPDSPVGSHIGTFYVRSRAN